jgi:hypothetical protein
MNRDFQQTTDEVAELEAKLAARYGQLMGSAALAEALGFASVSAFRQACWSGRIAIPMFNVPGRAGRFAFTERRRAMALGATRVGTLRGIGTLTRSRFGTSSRTKRATRRTRNERPVNVTG